MQQLTNHRRAPFNGWKHGPPHRRVLLGTRYRDVGVGVAHGLPFHAGSDRTGATYAAELGVRPWA